MGRKAPVSKTRENYESNCDVNDDGMYGDVYIDLKINKLTRGNCYV